MSGPATMATGWQCPNCGKAHPPHVQTCPVKERSLAERLRQGERRPKIRPEHCGSGRVVQRAPHMDELDRDFS